MSSNPRSLPYPNGASSAQTVRHLAAGGCGDPGGREPPGQVSEMADENSSGLGRDHGQVYEAYVNQHSYFWIWL